MIKPKDFYLGQKLRSVFWPDGYRIDVGNEGVDSIEIVMECGIMCGVPWALVTYIDGTQDKYNLVFVEGVRVFNKVSSKIEKEEENG